MTLTSIGDLAQSFALRRQSTELKVQMERLTAELSTGRTTDVARHLSGNLLDISDVEHKLAILDARRTISEQGRMESGVMQSALERLQSATQSLSDTALTMGSSATALSFASFANEAREVLGALVSTLNTSVAGRSLFAGDAVASPALAASDELLAAARTAVAGAATAADIMTALDGFFDTPGGGFDTLVYQGGVTPRASLSLGDGEFVTLDLRADDPVFRNLLKHATGAALLDDPGVALSGGEQADLTALVGERLLGGQGALTGLRADLGFAQSRIDRAATRISAEASSLSILRYTLLSVDPFETASELETVQLRLETIYTLTSRMSRLSLVNFLS